MFSILHNVEVNVLGPDCIRKKSLENHIKACHTCKVSTASCFVCVGETLHAMCRIKMKVYFLLWVAVKRPEKHFSLLYASIRTLQEGRMKIPLMGYLYLPCNRKVKV